MNKVAFVFILSVALSSITHANTESNGLSAVLTRKADGEFGPWLGEGKLVYQSVKIDTGRFGWYIYHSSSGSCVLLSGRLDGVNNLLSEEIAAGSSETFLTKYLAGLLVGAMAPAGSFIITNKFVKNFAPSDSRVAILRRYSLEPTPQIMGNDWILDFNVASDLGGIEHWHIAGQQSPIQIRVFSQTISEPNNSFVPILVTGGNAIGQKRSHSSEPARQP